MAVRLDESVLPDGCYVDKRMSEYRYRVFHCDMLFLAEKPKFNWQRHIQETFHNCLAGTLNRFMRVV